MNAAGGGGWKVQPMALACSEEMPMIQNARCAAITPPIRTAGRPNGPRERCEVRYSTSAIAQAALNSEIVMTFAK